MWKDPTLNQVAAVLKFWFEDIPPARWFNSDAAFDADIHARFLDVCEDLATGGAPHSWEDTPEGALAYIIALDQFPRNMFRGQAKAFAWDGLSLASAKRAVARGDDMRLSCVRRPFIYMPYMHAENLADQNRGVVLCETRLDDRSTARHARAHRDTIARFGRFPHRNAVLGRTPTPAETDYLDNGGYDPS